jgi:hypothetical protein
MTVSAKRSKPDAGLGQLRRIASAQQHRAEAVLEIGDRLADCGLRQIQPLAARLKPPASTTA